MSQTAIELATHPANAREVAFDVTGMTCASCVRRIEKALRRVDGVEQAAVNLATEKATIRYDATRTGMDQLKGAVEHAGYGVGELPAPPDAPAPTAAPGEVVLPIEGMTCASCVRRIEKRLSRVDGVDQANVNLATEQAHVVFDPALVDVQALTAAVEQAEQGAAAHQRAPRLDQRAAEG